LLWAWKLRNQKRQQGREECDSTTTQESRELLELYAADLENDLVKDETTILARNKEKTLEDIT